MNSHIPGNFFDSISMLLSVLIVAGRPVPAMVVRDAAVRGESIRQGKFVATDGTAWGAAVKWARQRGCLVEDLDAGTWTAGDIPGFLAPGDKFMSAARSGLASTECQKLIACAVAEMAGEDTE